MGRHHAVQGRPRGVGRVEREPAARPPPQFGGEWRRVARAAVRAPRIECNGVGSRSEVLLGSGFRLGRESRPLLRFGSQTMRDGASRSESPTLLRPQRRRGVANRWLQFGIRPLPALTIPTSALSQPIGSVGADAKGEHLAPAVLLRPFQESPDIGPILCKLQPNDLYIVRY